MARRGFPFFAGCSQLGKRPDPHHVTAALVDVAIARRMRLEGRGRGVLCPLGQLDKVHERALSLDGGLLCATVLYHERRVLPRGLACPPSSQRRSSRDRVAINAAQGLAAGEQPPAQGRESVGGLAPEVKEPGPEAEQPEERRGMTA